MELITNRLKIARHELWIAEGEIVPVGKEKIDMQMLIGAKMYKKNEESGEYEVNKDYDATEDKIKMEKVQIEFERLNAIIKDKENNVAKVMELSDKCIGGSMVFVDLAGNEWGSESKKIKGDTGIQARERQEINKSLLSLKECVRALHIDKEHVPYRDSKLTMVLRDHLKGINSTAIMIANISPSQNHIQKTYNTLLYSQLVAKA